MENQQETATLELGRIGYEAYRQHTGGISLASGQQLPIYDELNDQVRGAWIAAGSTIGMAIVDELKRSAAKSGGKASVKLSGEFAALVEAEDPEREHPTPEQRITPVQKPSIGRIVIYHEQCADGLLDSPAIIFNVAEGGVHLWVFNYNYPDQPRFAPYGTGAGQWSWPERVA